MSDKQKIYVPIAMPDEGAIMQYRRGKFVVRDTDGTEVIDLDVVVEQRTNDMGSKVVMSMDQAAQMIGTLIAASGYTAKDVMGMVEEAYEKAYAETDEKGVDYDAMREYALKDLAKTKEVYADELDEELERDFRVEAGHDTNEGEL